jgi:signal peptidase II
MSTAPAEPSSETEHPHPANAGARLSSVPPSGSRAKPSFVFFAVLAAIVLILDVGSKAWAEITLSRLTTPDRSMAVWGDSLSFVLAYNRGGAWGLLGDAPEYIRRPFFLVISLVAIGFIVSLYRKIQKGQWALRWGLPLVLGGALGNLSDRITRVGVVDFIDYRAAWVESMNRWIARFFRDWVITDHWPTFNVADIAICVGVGLMALDVLFAKKHHASSHRPSLAPSTNSGTVT